MTTATVKQLAQVALTNTLTTTLYTASGVKAVLKEILLCNTDTSARTVTIRAGASPATGVLSTILSAVNLGPGETRAFPLNTVLESGHLITGGASTGSVVGATFSGIEVS